ncbi:hypothetical protein [Minwuia sp.]|uniref:hypothetical protein n=1 Tax=Minwuia sp. TaxID=2493630 RepID=UPI003A94A04D
MPEIEVTSIRSGQTTAAFRFTSPNYETADFEFPRGLVAGNGLIGCLIHTFVAASPDWIALHAGAIEIDGGLTVLLGDNLAGKSTLSVALMALGHRLWCDDRLPVTGTETFEGMSLALRPKLRIPLPPNAPADFQTFVEVHSGPEEGEMRYLIPKDGDAAGFDARAPVARLVVLNRQGAGPTEVANAALGETVKRLVGCTFAPHLDPVALLARLRALAEQTACLRLTYSDSFDAAKHLSAMETST